METLKNLRAFEPSFYPDPDVGLHRSAAKTLGTNSNPELTDWYERATDYYNAVMSGQETATDPTAWRSLLDQMEWAAGELGLGAASSNWGDDIANDCGFPPAAAAQQPELEVPQGASSGTMDNLVWNSPRASITVPGPAGDGRVNDIWSNAIDMTLPSLSGRVTCELTRDTRLQPPEEVMKVVATDSATGAESVYFIHNYEDSTLTLRTPTGESQIVDLTGRAIAETYDPDAKPAEPAAPESSISGEPMSKNGEDFLLYDGSGTEVVDFKPTGSGVAKEKTIHDIEGNSNISVLNTDQVKVQKSAKGKDYDYVVTVVHADQSIDEFRIHAEYSCNLNAVPEHLQFIGATGKPYGQQAEISEKNPKQIVLPNDFLDSFTVNGLETVAPASKTPKPEKVVYPEEFANLAAALSLKPEALVDKLRESPQFRSIFAPYENKDGELGTGELKKIVADGAFPPLFPTAEFEDLVSFLSGQDPKLRSLLQACKADPENSRFKVTMAQVSARISDLLSAAYPSHSIAPAEPKPDNWFQANDLTFDGMSFEAFTDGWGLSPIDPYQSIDAMEVDPEDRGNVKLVVNE